MFYFPYVHYEVGCGGASKAMSQLISCLTHKKNDEQVLFLRTQNKVLLSIYLVLKHTQQQLLQILLQGHACIVLPLVCLFQFVYSVFCFLGIVFLFADRLFQQVFFCVRSHILDNKKRICSNDHQPFLYVLGIHPVIVLGDTIYKFWLTQKPPLRSRRSITC